MKRAIILALAALMCLASALAEGQIPYTLATREEGVEYLMSNTAYFDGLTQNDLNFRLQKLDATLEEHLTFARAQVRDFTEAEAARLRSGMDRLEARLDALGAKLPALEPVVFVRTTMKEECNAGAYTHGTQIYLGPSCLFPLIPDQELDSLLAHELFHCLTRSNPDFRRDMYALIHFTVVDAEYPIPDSVRQIYISNPDVEHHNASAVFHINGQDVACFTALVCEKPFEKPGDNFFDSFFPALVPVDGSDTFYLPKEAENFVDIFGRNTDYVIDPEECMADNFAMALVEGRERDYPTPAIIDGILDYLTQ